MDRVYLFNYMKKQIFFYVYKVDGPGENLVEEMSGIRRRMVRSKREKGMEDAEYSKKLTADSLVIHNCE